MIFLRKLLLLTFVFSFFLFSCSFEYGNKEEEENTQPDIIMENVEYIRIRGGDPVIRFLAGRAERYDERQIMNIDDMAFEQFENDWDQINIRGNAGKAQVEMESGNINLSEGVFISVDSEDIIIQTSDLIWLDNERQLMGSPEGAVDIQRSDGTMFTGMGFSADARYRTWTFEFGVSGILVETEDEETDEEDERVFDDDFLWEFENQ